MNGETSIFLQRFEFVLLGPVSSQDMIAFEGDYDTVCLFLLPLLFMLSSDSLPMSNSTLL